MGETEEGEMEVCVTERRAKGKGRRQKGSGGAERGHPLVHG